MLLAAFALTGCDAIRQQQPGSLVVRNARLIAGAGVAALELSLDCRLSGPVQDALEHGIPITLQVDLQAGRWPHAQMQTRRVELRYFPLSRRYQLREGGGTDPRSYPTPAYLVAALGALRFDLPASFAELPATTPLSVSARLDPAALPGALRLPALFEPAWRLASANYAWTLAAR
ncbi:DUF4390 domain-containing protein [Dokdonella sp.]|uniref:DUF4390 domain-containing protein n=1 Tax=Dokdonella sp. TaxID=2291710 RepID=UPI001B1C8943|nr:DUF4390 domain-containing protein [Dokdonella sp.]MBO9661850.1 DUF4390 domain-containing protein [Dokdonella sp.]